jgi:hypothetical protein
VLWVCTVPRINPFLPVPTRSFMLRTPHVCPWSFTLLVDDPSCQKVWSGCSDHQSYAAAETCCPPSEPGCTACTACVLPIQDCNGSTQGVSQPSTQQQEGTDAGSSSSAAPTLPQTVVTKLVDALWEHMYSVRATSLLCCAVLCCVVLCLCPFWVTEQRGCSVVLQEDSCRQSVSGSGQSNTLPSFIIW